MKTVLRKALSIFLVVVLLFIFNCFANATIQYDFVLITPVIQAQSNWCWAASAVMAGVVDYPSSTRTQQNVVRHTVGSIFNPYPNVQGTLQNSEDGTEYVTHNHHNYTAVNTVLGFSSIASYLHNGHAVQAGTGTYQNGVRTSGHMVVIYGAQFIDNSSGSYFYIDYVDPWDGTSHHCLFSSFCNGTYNAHIYDQTVYHF